MSPTCKSKTLRRELGDFSSIICFRAIVTGIEDALGSKAAMITLVSAGRSRGKQLAQQLGLSNASAKLDEVTKMVRDVLGAEGTRLCIIDKVEIVDSGKLHVYCRETICSTDEPQGSERQLSYTMGAIQGLLEEALGKRLRGKQIASVLRGCDCDVIEFTPLI